MLLTVKGVARHDRGAKNYAAITIAGTRRYNSLMILMDKWTDVLDSVKMSEDSHGKTMRTNAMVMDTYAKKVEQAKASMDSFYTIAAEGGGKITFNLCPEFNSKLWQSWLFNCGS